MSETAPEHPGVTPGGNILTRKFAGIPAWVILGGAALLAYIYFSHKQSTAASAQGIRTSSGSGSARTGKVTVQKGAVTINVKQDPGADQDQPTPTPPPRHHHTSKQNPDIDLVQISVDQARELRKRLSSPRIWLGQPGGEKVQIPADSDFQAQARKGKLYTTQYNVSKYLEPTK